MHGDEAPKIDGGKFVASFKSKIQESTPLAVFNKPLMHRQLDFNITGTEPSGKDLKFYRHPKITLPRDKFALLKEKFNWSITRDDKTADYHVISKNLLASTVHYSWTTEYIPGNEYMDFVEECEMLSPSTKQSLKDCYRGEEFAYIVNCYWYNHNYNLQTMASFADIVEGLKNVISKYQCKKTFSADGETYYKETTSEIKLQKSLDEFLDPVNKYVYDEYLVGLCNEDNPILKADDFDMIKKLLTSSDKHDISMALNVLSNCNINKSLDIVSYFFVFYHGWMREASTWNSVNVKSMRKSLEYLENIAGYNHQGSYGYDILIKFLKDKNSLTEFIFKKITNRIAKKYTEQFFRKEGVFKMPDIELKDDWKDFVISNNAMFDNVNVAEAKVEFNPDLPF